MYFAVTVMAVTTIPYLVGYAVQGQDWRFSGFVFGVEDGNSYLAKMARGSAGDWLFRTPYSALPQPGMLIFLPYLLLGKLVAPPASHEQMVALYHLFRFGAGLLAILATYDFLCLFMNELRSRRLGLVLAIVGGGLGWLILVAGRREWLGTLPLEFYSPESFGFLALFGIPHLALARALLLWSLVRFLRQVTASQDQNPTLGEGLKTGLLWLLAALAQPLTGMLLGLLVGLYLVGLAGWLAWRQGHDQASDWARWRRLLRLSVYSGLIPVVFWLYNLVAFQVDPFLRTWTLQSHLPAPHPLHYLLAYALLLPFAVLGGREALRANPWLGWMPLIWLLSLPFLAYAPFSMQRRLPEGVWVAIVTLAMVYIEKRRFRWLERPAPALVAVLICAFSSILIVVGGLGAALHPGLPLFRSDDETGLFENISTIASKEDVVLSAYDTGNALPAWTPQFVVIGHRPESAYFDSTDRAVRSFYQDSTSDESRRGLLQGFSVDYVVWGPAERALGGWSPAQATYLDRLWEQGEFELYKVIR